MGKKKTLRDHASDLADTLAPHVESARDKAGSGLADARDKAGPLLVDARGKAGPVLADARDKVAPVLADARDKAAPYLSDARDKAAPYLSDARDAAAPVLADAKDRFTGDVLPAVTAAIAAVDSATEDARGETKKRGKAVAAALKGEVEAPGTTHRGRNLLIALGLGGVAFAVVKKLGGDKKTANWQSAYTPPPAPSPAAAPVPDAGTHRADVADDVAASDPAEAVADAAEVPHETTTPDNPATEVDLDKS